MQPSCRCTCISGTYVTPSDFVTGPDKACVQQKKFNNNSKSNQVLSSSGALPLEFLVSHTDSWEGEGEHHQGQGERGPLLLQTLCRLRHLRLSWSPGLEGLGRHNHLQRLMAHGGGGGGAAWGVCRGLCGGGSGIVVSLSFSSLIAHGHWCVCVSGAASSGLTHCLFHPSECG